MHHFNEKINKRIKLFICFTLLITTQLIAATQEQKLIASDPAMVAYFGNSVSVSGDTAVAGANGVFEQGNAHGAAYVFEYDGSSWIESIKLSPTEDFENFGASVSISGNRIAVGASTALVNSFPQAGVVYIYEKDMNGDWIEMVRLSASDYDRYDKFGSSVSLDGDKLIVGVPSSDDVASGAGSAYIFEFDGNTWVETAKLTSSSPATTDLFGTKVDIDGDRAIVNSPFSDDAVVGTNVGSVFVFEKINSTWSETTVLSAYDLAEGDSYSNDISISGDWVLVGSQNNDDTASNTGSAYLFKYDSVTMTWDTGLKFNANDAVASDRFGASVEIDGNRMLIGATGNDDNNDSSSGSVYSYFYNGSSWDFIKLILHTDTPSRIADKFGGAISLDGNRTIIGSRVDDGVQASSTYDSGAAFIFDVDEAPVAVMDSRTINEDIFSANIDTIINDTDVDAGTKIVTEITQPVNGMTTIAFSGTIVKYFPNDNYCNDGITTDDFTYTLNGGSSATVKVTVTCVDDPAVAVDDPAALNEDVAGVNIAVLSNDTDVDGGVMNVASITQPAGGTAINHTAYIRYEPNANFCNTGNGTDDFTYTLNTGDTATVSVTVNCIDDFPVAVDDTPSVTEDDSATILTVLTNDTDIDGGVMTIIGISQPTNGTVANNTSTLSYTPDENYCNDGNTTDDFTYTLIGGDVATVNVTVNCVDDAPVAVDNSTTHTEDSGSILVPVLANDTDIDGGLKTIASYTQPDNGSVVKVNSFLAYTPNENYCNEAQATDDFTYTLNGGSQAAVSITVNCVDDAPVAVNDTNTIPEDLNSVFIPILTNDTDVDGGKKVVDSYSQPANGSVSTVNQFIQYVPDNNYCNDGITTDDFTYTLNGGSQATVAVTVTCKNDEPTFDIAGDIDASDLLASSNQLIIPNFADNFIYGPSDESSQTVLQFNVEEISDTDGVINTISMSPDGTLTIDFSYNSGIAMIEISMQDDGGTESGGSDTSEPIMFNVFYSDIIFDSGFETPDFFLADDYLNELTLVQQDVFASPTYDFASNAILYYGFMFELNSEMDNNYIRLKIKQWIREVNNFISHI